MRVPKRNLRLGWVAGLLLAALAAAATNLLAVVLWPEELPPDLGMRYHSTVGRGWRSDDNVCSAVTPRTLQAVLYNGVQNSKTTSSILNDDFK